MTYINLPQLKEELPAADYALVEGIVATRGKNKGLLRAAKPLVPRQIDKPYPPDYKGVHFRNTYPDFKNEADANKGRTAYIWRQVAFYVGQGQAASMPVTDIFDLPGILNSPEQKADKAHLDGLVDKILSTLPLSEKKGLIRWGKALGLL